MHDFLGIVTIAVSPKHCGLRVLQKPILKPIVSQRNFSTTLPSLASEEDAEAMERDVEEEENEEEGEDF